MGPGVALFKASNAASTSFQPTATDPLHSAGAHVRIGISNVMPIRETGFWRSPTMLSWWRRRRPTIAQPGGKQRRLVFVLGGGGSRGACSVGVLKALLEAGIIDSSDAVVLTHDEFDALSDERLKEVMPKLRALAQPSRSSMA